MNIGALFGLAMPQPTEGAKMPVVGFEALLMGLQSVDGRSQGENLLLSTIGASSEDRAALPSSTEVGDSVESEKPSVLPEWTQWILAASPTPRPLAQIANITPLGPSFGTGFPATQIGLSQLGDKQIALPQIDLHLIRYPSIGRDPAPPGVAPNLAEPLKAPPGIVQPIFTGEEFSKQEPNAQSNPTDLPEIQIEAGPRIAGPTVARDESEAFAKLVQSPDLQVKMIRVVSGPQSVSGKAASNNPAQPQTLEAFVALRAKPEALTLKPTGDLGSLDTEVLVTSLDQSPTVLSTTKSEAMQLLSKTYRLTGTDDEGVVQELGRQLSPLSRPESVSTQITRTDNSPNLVVNPVVAPLVDDLVPEEPSQTPLESLKVVPAFEQPTELAAPALETEDAEFPLPKRQRIDMSVRPAAQPHVVPDAIVPKAGSLIVIPPVAAEDAPSADFVQPPTVDDLGSAKMVKLPTPMHSARLDTHSSFDKATVNEPTEISQSLVVELGRTEVGLRESTVQKGDSTDRHLIEGARPAPSPIGSTAVTQDSIEPMAVVNESPTTDMAWSQNGEDASSQDPSFLGDTQVGRTEEKSTQFAIPNEPLRASTRTEVVARPLAVSSEVREAVLRQVADRIEMTSLLRAREAVTIHLDPLDLGQIRVVLTHSEGRMDAQIYAQDERVQQVLASSHQDLSRALDSRGIRLDAFRVDSFAGTASSASDQGHRAPSEQSPTRHFAFREPASSATPRPTARVQTSALDLAI